jgi:hypothetical protein
MATKLYTRTKSPFASYETTRSKVKSLLRNPGEVRAFSSHPRQVLRPPRRRLVRVPLPQLHYQQEDFGEEEVDGDEVIHKNKKSVRFLRDDEIEGQVLFAKVLL